MTTSIPFTHYYNYPLFEQKHHCNPLKNCCLINDSFKPSILKTAFNFPPPSDYSDHLLAQPIFCNPSVIDSILHGNHNNYCNYMQ